MRRMGGYWIFVQGTGHHVHCSIETDTHVRGTAPHRHDFRGSATEADKVGIIEGSNTASQCNFRIHWGHGPVGVYNGQFDFNGFLTGINFEEQHPDRQTTFVVTSTNFADDGT